MKNVKKLVSLFVAVCMLLTALGGLTVSAATEPTASHTIDFNSFAANTNFKTADGTAVTFRTTASNLADGLCQYENVTGIRGKEDGVLKMYPKTGTEIPSDRGEAACMTGIGETNPVTVKNGEYYEISFDYSWSGSAAGDGTEFRGFYGSNNAIMYFFKTLKDGKLKTVFGQDVQGLNYFFTKNAWYHIRMIVKANDEVAKHHYYFYVNDALIADGDFTPCDRNGNNTVTSAFTGFNFFNLLQYTDIQKGTTYQNADPPVLYIDNFTTSAYAQLPEMQPMVMGYNFDNITPSEATTEIANEIGSKNAYWQSLSLRTDAGHEAKIVDGALGKAAGDHSLYLYQSAKPTDASSLLVMPFPGYGTSAASEHSAKVKPGEYTNLEVYMAWDGTSNYKQIQGFYNTGKDGDGKGSTATVAIATDGSVAAFGKTVANVKLMENTWYKLNLVIHSDSQAAENDADKNWFKLYINDELAQDQTVFVPTARTSEGSATALDSFMGLKQLWLQSTNIVDSYPTAGAYFDDLTVEYTKTEPGFTPTTVTYSTDNANMVMAGTLSSYTGTKMQGATASVSDGTIQIVNASGQDVDTFTGGGDHFRIIKADGTKLYGFTDNSQKVVEDRGDFTAAEDGTPNELQYYQFADKGGTASVQTGLAGKNAADNFVTLQLTDCVPESASKPIDPFFAKWVSNSSLPNASLPNLNAHLPYTVEMTVRLEGDYSYSNMQLYPDATVTDLSTGINVIQITPDGRIIGLDNSVVTYNKGEWVKLAATVYPKANKIETFVNGRRLARTEFMKGLAEGKTAVIARYKFEQGALGDGESKKSFAFSFDNLKTYNGVYEENAITLTDSTGTFDIYNTGRVIFTNDASYADDFAGDVSGYQVTPVLFTDAGLAQTTNEFAEGSILAVPNTKGDIIKYYYVSVGAPEAVKVKSITNSNGTPAGYAVGTNNLKVNMLAFKPMNSQNITVVAAEKNISGMNQLLSAGTVTNEMNAAMYDKAADAYCYPAAIQSGVITMQIQKPKEESKLELYVWDDNQTPMTTLMPISR